MENIHYLEPEVNYKRFIVFFYDSYRAFGALEDTFDSFNDLDDAINCIKKNFKNDHVSLFDCIAQREIDITQYGLKY
ncbi:hypothetical protein [Empedobacter brevis]|uniref:hypothetical protein n=1 Tax=Empedobacter brevis TaxID=247 RepID=UPI003340F29D